MMEPPAAEFTIICIDNAERVFWRDNLIQAQIEAAKFYCKTVFECNPNNIVSILTMSTGIYNILVRPTSDPQRILCALEGVRCQYDGKAKFQTTLSQACLSFSSSPTNMKRRLLMFVGGTIHLAPRPAVEFGMKLKSSGVALDVFNFYHLNVDPPVDSIYRYAKRSLVKLVNTANDNGNSHIIDIADQYESSVIDTLTKRILKTHLGYLDQTAAADEKNKSAVDENFNVKKQFGKQTLGLFPLKKHHNCLDQKAAAAENYQNVEKQFGKRKLGNSPEDDDECRGRKKKKKC